MSAGAGVGDLVACRMPYSRYKGRIGFVVEIVERPSGEEWLLVSYGLHDQGPSGHNMAARSKFDFVCSGSELWQDAKEEVF